MPSVARGFFRGAGAQQTPADLTDDDLIVLEGFGGQSSAAVARARREQALAPPPPPNPPAPVTTPAETTPTPTTEEAWAGVIVAGLAPVFKSYLAKIKALEADVEKLKADHAALDAKALKGGAVWARGVAYAVNDIVQHDGSLWRCLELHVSGASFSHECLLLQVKRGRDGRDAR